MKDMFKAGWERVKTGVGNTFGKAFNKCLKPSDLFIKTARTFLDISSV